MMTLKKLVGYLLISSPFVAIFIFASIQGGIEAAVYTFLAAVGIVSVIAAGVYLTNN